jgi:hypothetical protein
MAIEDYLPNVFGSSAPSYLQGLLGAEETQKLQGRANVQGLLGAGLALAQGMSRIGPRRSAAENILGALAGGFGAAGGAYDQGVKNYVTQQQIAQTQLAQAQAANKLRSIAQAKAKYPDLAPLFDIDSGEAVKQVMLRERSQRYQSFLGGSPTDAVPQQGQVPGVQTTAAPTTQVSPVSQQPSEFPSTKFVTRAGTELIGVPNFAAGERYVDDKLNQQFQPVSGQTPSSPQLVNPVNVQKANRLRMAAQQAILDGDTPTANFYNSEANRIDPPEQITFRDGMAYSNKSGLLGRFTEYKRLTKEEIAAEGLPDNKIWQRGPDNRIYAVEGSDVTPQLNKKQLIESLPTQANNVYKTLQPRFNALVNRAPGLTAEQINSELVSILDADSKILADLDPTLQAAEITRRKAGKTELNVYPPGSMPLGKEGSNKVDTQLLDLGQSRLRLQSISSNFNPKYLETPFKLRMEAVAQLEKLGQKPNAQDAADLAAYSEFAQTAYNELNGYINLITGAAVGSGDEEARLRKGIPDPQKDSPTQFLSKLNSKLREGRLYEARLGYIKNKGMRITDAGIVDVNQIPTLMRNREAEIKKTAKLFGGKEFNAKDPNHNAIVRSILSQEFGLVD